MQRLIILALITTLGVAIACQKPAPPLKVENARTPTPAPAASTGGHDEHEGDDAPRITLADAKKDFDAGNAVFIDTRTAEAYQMEHIKGAINIPANALEANLNKIPKGKKIIAYCS